MNIYEAKQSLEKIILLWDGVVSIGVVRSDNDDIIEIGVDEQSSITSQIQQLIPNHHWEGYRVSIKATGDYTIF